MPLSIGARSDESFWNFQPILWLEEWNDAANLPHPHDYAGADREIDDHGELVDVPKSKVFEMDQSYAICTEGLGGLGGLDRGGHL